MTRAHTKWRLATIVALLIALIALPALAWAEDNPAKPAPATRPEIPAALQTLWDQLLALRAEHEELGAELREQLGTNRDLIEQLSDKAKAGPVEDIRALVQGFRLFQEEELRPLREQAGDTRRALADARRERNREALATARAELSGLLGQWRQAREQANGMAARIRQVRQTTLPIREIIRECREQLAPLHEQSRLIRLEIAQSRLAKDVAWQEFRSALEAGDLAAAEAALLEIITLKQQLIELTGDLLDLAEQAGAILEETLALF